MESFEKEIKKEDLVWRSEVQVRASDYCRIRHATLTECKTPVMVHQYEDKQTNKFSLFEEFELKINMLRFLDRKALTPHNVRPLGVIPHPGKKLIVFEDLGDTTLQRILDLGSSDFTRKMVVELVFQISRALSVYSEMKLTNKAVHPDNIYRYEDRWVLGPPSPEYLHGEIEINGKIMKYQPPEYGHEKDHSGNIYGDVWGLGVIATYLLALTKSKAEDSRETSTSDQEDPGFIKSLILPILRSGQTNVTPTNAGLLDIVGFCMQPVPTQRWKPEVICNSSVG